MTSAQIRGPIPIPKMDFFVIPKQIEDKMPDILTITGVSDTLATIYTQSNLRMAWLLGSFSIIALEHALEKILLEDSSIQKQVPKKGKLR